MLLEAARIVVTDLVDRPTDAHEKEEKANEGKLFPPKQPFPTR